jgi:hypothetical protein
MDPIWVGVAALPALLLAGPIWRRISHDRALRGLALEGAAVVPNGFGLSGLRIARAGWDAELRFTDTPIWGGRPGHVRFSAVFREAPKTGRLQGPGAALEARGAQVALTGEKSLDVAAPMPADLAGFVALCVALAEAAA